MKKTKSKNKAKTKKPIKATFASISTINQSNISEEAYAWSCDRIRKLEAELSNLKTDQQIQRNKVITEWLSSLATINDAIAHAIAEGAISVR